MMKLLKIWNRKNYDEYKWLFEKIKGSLDWRNKTKISLKTFKNYHSRFNNFAKQNGLSKKITPDWDTINLTG